MSETWRDEMNNERDALLPYFDLVCDKKNWKAPIDAFCRIEYTDNIRKAIVFFTATQADFTQKNDYPPGWCRVQAIGYRNGPAGDK
jgi:hypothetical protein